MRNEFLTFRWAAAVLAFALLAVTVVRADNEPNSRNRGGARSNNSGRRSNNESGRGSNNDGGQKSGTTGGTIINKAAPVAAPGGVGAANNKKVPDKSAWKNATKDGWHKDGWNNNFNSQHQLHRHGYWNNGIWIAPWFIASNQRWIYLQPAQPIVSGQKWLGVTYEPYDGGGAYVNGIYQGSPAQRVGLEVGDVIVSLDGVDATQLGSVIQASNGNVVLQVLSGRTGGLVETPVNLIR